MTLIIDPYFFPTAFSPSDISGLKLWLDAGQGITKDGGDLVSAWADQSGEGNDVAQATGTNQPLWVSSGLNSLPTVQFDNVDNYMNRATFTGGAISSGFSVYLVVKIPTDGDNSTVFDGGSSRAIFSCDGGAPNALLQIINLTTIKSATEATGTFVIYRCIFDGASSSLFADRVSLVAGDAGAVGMNGITLNINSSFATASCYGIELAEKLIYDSVLSVGDDDDVMTYLEDKYAL